MKQAEGFYQRADPTGLQPGEALVISGKLEVLTYFRLPDPFKPLVIFLPGAGHLARVAYGHPGSRRHDFLDYWLSETGWGLLAVSYPCGHSIVRAADPALSIADWAQIVSRLVADKAQDPRGPLVVVGWSMAGRSAAQLAEALRGLGIELACFIPLAASPALPGLSSISVAQELSSPDGMWDTHGSPAGACSRHEVWLADLRAIEASEGRTVIDPGAYRIYYTSRTPPGLMAEPGLCGTGPIPLPSWENYPLIAAISPSGSSDVRHALADQATWGFINAQALMRRHVLPMIAAGKSMSEPSWARLLALFEELPGRLHRHVPGNHFCFIGTSGARATTKAIAELETAAYAVRTELSDLLRGSLFGVRTMSRM